GASCELECDGGACRQACAPGAHCDTDCDGGDCTGVAVVVPAEQGLDRFVFRFDDGAEDDDDDDDDDDRD
ncbi:MAG: hypothetical protein AB7L28_29985, partial [Kofleriaceae bacterium]